MQLMDEVLDAITRRYPVYLPHYLEWKGSERRQSFIDFLFSKGYVFATFVGDLWAKWKDEQVAGMDKKQLKEFDRKEPDIIKHLHLLCYINSNRPDKLGNAGFCVTPDKYVREFPFNYFNTWLFQKRKEKIYVRDSRYLWVWCR